MKSNNKKRILAAVLCMVMVLSSSISALASEEIFVDMEAETAAVDFGDSGEQGDEAGPVDDNTGAETEPPAESPNTEDTADGPETEADSGAENGNGDVEVSTPQEGLDFSDGTASEADTGTEGQILSEETELKQEFVDTEGNVVQRVTAKLPAGAFAAETSAVTMEVSYLDTDSANYIKTMITEAVPKEMQPGSYVFFDIQFKVNGEKAEALQPVTVTIEGSNLAVTDPKKANVFYFDPADPGVEGDKDQLAEIPQRNQLMESLQAAGESTENIEDYDLSEITFREDGSADKVIFEARKSTIYGCYEETEADSQEKPEGSETPEDGQEQIPEEDGTAEETQVEITADQVNLRTTPSPEEENVEALAYAGERYPLLESVQEGEELWYKIRYTYPESGQAAELYVRSDCAQIVGEAGNTDKEETEITEEPGMVTELIYEDDRVSVTVSAAEEGIIPEGAILKVVPITEENTETQTQYQEVAQQLAAKTAEEDKQIAGFLAYDIYLADAEGNETEPNGQVKVSMNYKEAAVPEAVAEIGPENTEVTVYHLEENADGEVQNVVDMQAAEQVETLETAEEQEVETVEVVTDSFSVYAVAWNTQAEPRAEKTNFEIRWKDHKDWGWADGKPDYGYKRIYLHFVDENGKDISSDLEVTQNIIEISGNGNITNDSSQRTTLQKIGEQYNKNKLGVYFTAAHLDGYEDQVVTNISYNPNAQNSYDGNAWIYQNGNANWTGWKKEYVNSCHVYMVYKPRNPLSIEDQIIDDGSLTAVLSPDGILENAENVTYTWFRGDQADGSQNGQNYAPVEREVYENNKFNISEKGDKLYPAYNDGARRWYKVKLTCTIDGEKKEWVSEPYQVPYYDELQNGGFEAVNLDGRTTNAWYKSQGGVWQSTGAGKEEGDTVDKNIEVVSTRNKGNIGPYFWDPDLPFKDAEEKDSCFRFAEINCSGAGAMYQDVLTMDGEALNYWLSHRARGGQYGAEEREWDEMYLVIVPTKTAVENNLSTQENLNNFLRDQGIELSGEAPSEETNGVEVLNTQSEDVLVARICSDDQDWHEISVTAGYKPSASLTRFFFMSGKTASGSDTIGNFIDKVGFGQTLPPAKPDEFSLQLTKKIQGLTQEERKQVKDELRFDISATDEQGNPLTNEEIVNLFGIKTIHGSDMDSSPDGITLTYKILDRPIKGKYQVTITETGGELENYTIQPSYKITVNGEESAENEGIAAKINSLEGETTVNVEFTNTYKPKVTSITVRKLWHDNNAFNRPEAIDFDLYRDDKLYEEYRLTASDAESDTSWMKVIDNLPADGTYTVKEVSLDGYDYSSNITTSEDGSVFTITNTLNWYVKKTDKSQEKNLQGAEFTLKKEDQIIASGVSGEDGQIDWTESGQGLDKDILKQLDGKYTLVETKAPSGYRLNEAGWTLTFEKGLLKSGTDNKTGESLSLTSDGKTGVVLTVTNEMIYALPSTGGNGIFGYMISGTLLMMAATLILYKMKYKGVRKS